MSSADTQLWRRCVVAAAGTHHEVDGQPLYAARFDEVLRFHAPGLAPVRSGADAWHIAEHGGPAYARRFRRTVGFYEGLAAVDTGDGWVHIGPTGDLVHTQLHAWCGNFQGQRCAVRSVDGAYFHIDATGRAVAAARWRYVGDYRDGVAVVQAEHGRSTHIDHDGGLIHARWFLDLDVYHKGFARARDTGGWTHIDRRGLPIHARRFAMIEPFYNGQARVERFDGGLEIIDEAGVTRVELRGGS